MQTVERLGITPYSQGKIHGLEILGISSTEVPGRALRGGPPWYCLLIGNLTRGN